MTDKVTTPVAIIDLQLLSLKEAGERLATVHAIIPDGVLPVRTLDSVPDVYEISGVEYQPATLSVDVTVHRVPVKFKTEDYSNLRQAFNPFAAQTESKEEPAVRAALTDRQFMFNIPLAYAQTALLLSTTTATPFLAITRQRDLSGIDPAAGYAGLSSVIASPQYGTPAFSRLNSVIQKASTGRVIAALSQEELGSIRFQVVRILAGIASGRLDALMEIYSHINEYDIINAKSKDETYIPTDDEQHLIALQDFIFALLRNSAGTVVANYIGVATTPPAQRAAELSEFEELMKSAGFNETEADPFTEMTGSGFDSVNPNSSNDAKLAFLSAPITPDTIPPSMLPLLDKINIPALYEIDWDADALDERINTGEGIAAASIVAAIRLLRAQHISLEDSLMQNISIAIMVFLSFPNEQIIWGVVETVKNLPTRDGKAVFQDVLGFPSPAYKKDPRSLGTSPAGFILHQFGHAILREGWSDEIIRTTFKDLDIILSFIDDVKEIAERSADDHDEQALCPSAQGIMGLVSLGFQLPDITTQLGEALLRLAELNAWHSSQAVKDSPEWKVYEVDYLSALALNQDHSSDDDDDEDDEVTE